MRPGSKRVAARASEPWTDNPRGIRFYARARAAVVAIAVLVIGVAFAMGRLWVPNLLLDAAVIGVLVAVQLEAHTGIGGPGRRSARGVVPAAALAASSGRPAWKSSRRCSHRSAATGRSNHDY